MFPSSKTKLKYIRMSMAESTKRAFETKLPEFLCDLPSEKWKVELCRRIKEFLDASSNGKNDGPWHSAIGTKFAINTTNKGNGFGHIMIGQYIHLVVWQTTENIAILNEETDLNDLE